MDMDDLEEFYNDDSGEPLPGDEEIEEDWEDPEDEPQSEIVGLTSPDRVAEWQRQQREKSAASEKVATKAGAELNAFEALLGRRPDPGTTMRLLRVKETLKISSDDPIWMFFLCLGHFETLYGEIATKIRETVELAPKYAGDAAKIGADREFVVQREKLRVGYKREREERLKAIRSEVKELIQATAKASRKRATDHWGIFFRTLGYLGLGFLLTLCGAIIGQTGFVQRMLDLLTGLI